MAGQRSRTSGWLPAPRGLGVASPYGYVIHCAPEVIDPGETTAKTDVYALGMTLYRLLNGDSFLPDVAELGVPRDEAIVAGDFPDRTRFRDHIPKAVVRLVRKAISFDPAKNGFCSRVET